MLMDPFFTQRHELEQLRREMNRLFADFPSPIRRAPAYPAINIWSNQDGAVVTAELPGCNPDKLDISVIGDMLSIAGSREAEATGEDVTYHRRERGYGSFKRTFQLPFEIEAQHVKATFENGVLHLSLPRAEASKPKKIVIRTA